MNALCGEEAESRSLTILAPDPQLVPTCGPRTGDPADIPQISGRRRHTPCGEGGEVLLEIGVLERRGRPALVAHEPAGGVRGPGPGRPGGPGARGHWVAMVIVNDK